MPRTAFAELRTLIQPPPPRVIAAWFVADTRVHCTINSHWSACLGADNVLNRKYFLFHPFPQRTVIADVKLAF